MRKLVILGFAIVAFITKTSILSAQRTFTSGHFMLQIGDAKFALTNFSYLDSLTPDRREAHAFKFDLPVSEGDIMRKIYDNLQNALAGRSNLPVLITTTDFNYNMVTERSYPDAVVSSIIFDELNAASKDNFAIHVQMTANTMIVKKVSGKYSGTDLGRGTKFMAANFKLSLGKLPVKFVSVIDNIRLTSDDQTVDLLIRIAETDAEPWYEEFKNNIGQKATLTGAISLLSPDLSKSILNLDISEAEIISISGGKNDQSKIEVGVRVKKLMIGK